MDQTPRNRDLSRWNEEDRKKILEAFKGGFRWGVWSVEVSFKE
jgi:hypothetical protein